jgi:hypothetical protein
MKEVSYIVYHSLHPLLISACLPWDDKDVEKQGEGRRRSMPLYPLY